MGGDSLVSWGDGCQVTSEPKIWRAAPRLVIGASGDAAACDIAVAVPPPPIGELSAREWAVTRYVPALREALAEANSADLSLGLLIGAAGELLEVCGWGVLSLTDYGATGSGGSVALGALSVLPPRKTPRHRIISALEAAEKHTVFVRRPWTILHT